MLIRSRLISAVAALTLVASACSPNASSRTSDAQQEGGPPTSSLPIPALTKAAVSAGTTKDVTGTSGRVSVHMSWTMDEAASTVIQKMEVSVDGSRIFDHEGDGKGSVVNVTEHWYPPATGVATVLLTTDGKTMSGSVDGRHFDADSTSAPVATWRFADGGNAPVLSMPNGLAADQQRAFDGARQSAAEASVGTDVATGTELTTGTVGLALSSPQDFGHISDPGTGSGCQGCRAGCIVAGGAGGFVCGVLTFGIGTAACLAAATAALSACELAACHSACCPLQCSSSSCCNSGESCLNTGNGLCCSSGKLACAGKECCTSDEACISQGPNRGACCNNANVCGPNCCDSTEVCQNFGTGQCCLPGGECGTACCAHAGNTFNTLFCADASRSLCCAQGQVACNGVCCGDNQQCINGACAFPTNVNCGGETVCVNSQNQLDQSLCGLNQICESNGCCFTNPP